MAIQNITDTQKRELNQLCRATNKIGFGALVQGLIPIINELMSGEETELHTHAMSEALEELISGGETELHTHPGQSGVVYNKYMDITLEDLAEPVEVLPAIGIESGVQYRIVGITIHVISDTDATGGGFLNLACDGVLFQWSYAAMKANAILTEKDKAATGTDLSKSFGWLSSVTPLRFAMINDIADIDRLRVNLQYVIGVNE